jgi:N-terminal acetyltransferase B complex non-catalytic subunit
MQMEGALMITWGTQIPNFVEFEEKLECSLQRDLTKMEHTRMRLGFEAQAVESLVLELQDLQLTIVRGGSGCTFYGICLADIYSAHHDNRDMSVIPNYQPRGQNIVDQTSMGPSPGVSPRGDCHYDH